MEKEAIFGAVLSRLMESLAPKFSNTLSGFISDNLQDSEASMIPSLEVLFRDFPRLSPDYKATIMTLIRIAETSPSLAIIKLVKIMRNLISGEQVTPFSALKSAAVWDPSNRYHQFIFSYYSLILSTDLICQILAMFSADDKAVSQLCDFVYSLFVKRSKTDKIEKQLINQWAVILGLISESDLPQVASLFKLFANAGNYCVAFGLMKYVRMENEDAFGERLSESILSVMRQLQKKKQLTSSIMDSVASMIVTMPYNEDNLQKVYDMAYPLRGDANPGANMLLIVLMMRSPKRKKKLGKFVADKVLPNAGNPKFLVDSLNQFRMYMFGGNVDPQWLFWEWGQNPRSCPLEYIKWNGQVEIQQSDQHSYSSLFMNHYFKKADFSLAPSATRDILVHLASLDFGNFVANIVPKFLSLENSDPRFAVLMMTMVQLNSQSFREKALKKVSDEDVANLNRISKDKVMSAMSVYEQPTRKFGVYERLSVVDNQSEESDVIISEMLEKWSIRGETRMADTLNSSRMAIERGTLESELIHVFPFVFTGEDLVDPRIFTVLVKSMASINGAVAQAAVGMCRSVVSCHCGSQKVLETMSYLIDNVESPESLYMEMNLLNVAFSRLTSDCVITSETYYSIEACAFLAMCSANPPVRLIGWRLLEGVNSRIGDRGLYSYIRSNLTNIEIAVKNRLLAKHRQRNMVTGLISFEKAISSSYWGVWLCFIQDMMKVVVAHNYVPLLQFLSSTKISKSRMRILTTGLLVVRISARYDVRVVKMYVTPPSNQYQPWPEKQEKHYSKLVSSVVNELLVSYPDKAFELLPYLHFSLYHVIVKILSRLSSDYAQPATRSFYLMLANPNMEPEMIRSVIRLIGDFLNNVQFYIASKELSGAKVIEWNEDRENKLIEYRDFVTYFCWIGQILFSVFSCGDRIGEDVWPISSRQVVFRIYSNWTNTKSPMLQSVREAAEFALSDIVKTGPVFSDVLIIDDNMMRMLQSLEQRYGNVLLPFLKFHFEQLLDIYIDWYYRTDGHIADTYFAAISEVMPDHASFDALASGQLILLAIVAAQRGQSNNSVFLQRLADAIGPIHIASVYDAVREQILNTDSTQILSEYFQYATEAVFSAAFKVLQMPDRRVAIRDVVTPLLPWASMVRLLPKQTVIARGVTNMFAYFTPYRFLEKLAETTEVIGQDQIDSILPIWRELSRSPDNAGIVPLFVRNWNCSPELKKRLLSPDPVMILQRLLPYCSFAYYFHVSMCVKKDFENELWICDVISNALTGHWENCFDHLVAMTHFAFMYRNKQPRLFELVCRNLEVDCPEATIPSESLGQTVVQIMYRVKLIDQDNVKKWANEALKWLIGSPSIKFAAISSVVYNHLYEAIASSGQRCELEKERSEEMVQTVIRTVEYHLTHFNAEEEMSLMSTLVRESFNCLKMRFRYNELDVFAYASSFIDCRVFVESSLASAMPIFMLAVQFPETARKAWQLVISFVRPMVTQLETNKVARKRLAELIRNSNSHELLMIAAAVMRTYPQEFEKCMKYQDVLNTVSESVMCKSLVHYSMMVLTASKAVTNSIFEISAYIVDRVVDENNQVSLAKIYMAALHSITECPAAIDFIRAISEHQPAVVNVKVMNVYEWDRSVEDVTRNVKQLVKPDNSPIVTITECEDYTSVTRFLYSEQMPKILPFEADREMLDGMRSVTKPSTTRRAFSLASPKRRVAIVSAIASPFSDVQEPISPETPDSYDDYEALAHPKELVMDGLVIQHEELKLRRSIEQFFNDDIPAAAPAVRTRPMMRKPIQPANFELLRMKPLVV